jgi:hypothetical protein
MITPQWIAKISEESEQIELQLGNLAGKMESLADHSKLNCLEDPRGIGQGYTIHDMASIHFDTTHSNQTDRNTYLMALANDLTIQNLETAGRINEMQERLKRTLCLEYVLKEIEGDIAHGTISQCSALYLIINAIPCILHLENRVGLKIFTRLLRIGLDNVKEGVILGTKASKNIRIQAQYGDLKSARFDGRVRMTLRQRRS